MPGKVPYVDGLASLCISTIASKKQTRKDTVRSHKSITRDINVQGKAPQKSATVKAPQRKAEPHLPSTPATRGLTFKHPKMKGKSSEKLITNRLKKSSPWYASIEDPLHGADAKIPDETGVETGTCQLVERVQLKSNAQGVAGLKVISPYINSVPNTNGAKGAGRNLQYPSTTAGTLSIDWGSTNYTGGAWNTNSGEPFESTAGLQQITNQHRVVSAAMYVQPEVSLADASGEYCLFMSDWSNEASATYTDYLNRYKSVSIPLNSPTNSAVIRWFPVARQDWSFKSFIRTNGTSLTNDDDRDLSTPYWNFGFLSNCPADVSFRLTIVVNYEFIPKNNVLNVLDTSPSPQDSMEVDLVERWVQDMPTAKPVREAVVSSSPTSVTPQHGENDEGTGFGMFFNVVKELAPIAMALL